MAKLLMVTEGDCFRCVMISTAGAFDQVIQARLRLMQGLGAIDPNLAEMVFTIETQAQIFSGAEAMQFEFNEMLGHKLVIKLMSAFSEYSLDYNVDQVECHVSKMGLVMFSGMAFRNAIAPDLEWETAWVHASEILS